MSVADPKSLKLRFPTLDIPPDMFKHVSPFTDGVAFDCMSSEVLTQLFALSTRDLSPRTKPPLLHKDQLYVQPMQHDFNTSGKD